MRRFTNHANNKMKPKNIKKLSLPQAATSPESQPTVSLFDVGLTGRSLFTLENDAAINELCKKIIVEEDIPAGAARDKAVKRLWTEADHQLWESKAKANANDVFKNQSQFPTDALQALRTLSESGRLHTQYLVRFPR